jgi:hypothetical protein
MSAVLEERSNPEADKTVEEAFDAMFLNSDHLKAFKRWIESQNLSISNGLMNNLQFIAEVLSLKRKAGDVSSACQKVAAKYLIIDAATPVHCEFSKLEAFRALNSLFGVQTPGVFDEIFLAVRPSLFTLWQKFPNRTLVLPSVSVDSTPVKGEPVEPLSPKTPTPVSKPTPKSDSKVFANLLRKKSVTPHEKEKESKKEKEEKEETKKRHSKFRRGTKSSGGAMDEDSPVSFVNVEVKADGDVHGLCATCSKAVVNNDGIRFGLNVFHSDCLKCRVCQQKVDIEDAKAQSRLANQPICKNCR